MSRRVPHVLVDVMLYYSIRRTLIVIPTMVLVLTIVFFMIRVAPGDPAMAVLGQYATEESLQALRQEMGLDRPLYVQYLEYITGIIRGDLGRSMVNYNPIWPQVRFVLPHTFRLTLAGMLVGCIIGIPLGIMTALRRNSTVDYMGRTFSLSGLSVPSFYLGILLIFFFSVKINIFPAMGGEDATSVKEVLFNLTLPAVALGLIMSAYISRMARSAMLNVLNEDYVRTARSKGLGMRAVVGKHALKNAFIPIITVIGMYVGVLIADSVLIEIVFSRPGLGKLMVGAMMSRDYNMLQSILAIYAGIIVAVNLFTDLTYAIFDPRIKYK